VHSASTTTNCSRREDRRHRMHGRLWWSVAPSGCPVWPRPRIAAADIYGHCEDSDVNKSETRSKIALPPFLEIDITSYLHWGCTDLDEIRQSNAEWHAEYGDVVKIETGSRIPIWRTVVFFKTEVVVSQPWIKVCRWHQVCGYVDLRKRMTPSAKPEVVLRRRGCYFESQ